MNQPTDWKSRQQAIDPSQSFAITAPAGSGKTGLLTQRVLTLLPLCNTPEEILCITFTRKAAAEMLERISEALQRAAFYPRPDNSYEASLWDLAAAVVEHDKKMGWHLIDNPKRLRIQTIDGLCRNLTLMNPIDAQTAGNAGILDQPAECYQRATEQLFMHLGSEDAIGEHLTTLLDHMDNNLDQLARLLTGLLARRSQWLPYLFSARDSRSVLERSLGELVTESLENAKDLLALRASDLCQVIDFAATNCAEDKIDNEIATLQGIVELPATTADQRTIWKIILQFLTTTGDKFRSKLTKKEGFPPASDKQRGKQSADAKLLFASIVEELNSQPEAIQQLTLLKRLPNELYPDKQWQVLNSLTRVLPVLVGELKLMFRQLNAVDFTEINLAALESLGGEDLPTDSALMLDYQIHHILVDEFQDTSTPQLQLLEKLTAGWQPGDGRSLFIVGDGMQSCYGFRDANVGIFLDARDQGIGSVPLNALNLTDNFRSYPAVIDWVNVAFSEAFPKKDDVSRGAVRYASSVAFHSEHHDSGCETHILIGDTADRTAEADKVAELAKQALAHSEDESIAILVRGRGHLREILPALRRQGIPWLASDIDPLHEKSVIVDLVTLTRTLNDVTDRHAWIALLRSRWCGLNMEDLLIIGGRHQMTKDQSETFEYRSIYYCLMDPDVIKRLSESGKHCVQRLLEPLNLCWEKRRRKSLKETLLGLWLSLGGPAALDDQTDQQDVDDFFKLLNKFDQGGRIANWTEFEGALRQLYAKPDTQNNPRVQVMTIHKSKGLEFDTVIITGLDKIGRSNEKDLLVWQERINAKHQPTLLLSPLEARDEDSDELYEFIRQEHKQRDQYESTRLLYVGCTRAIRQLHLLACLKPDEKNRVKPPSKQSLLNTIWPTVKDSASYCEINEQEKDPNQEAHVTGLWRLPEDLELPPLIPETLLTRYRGRESSDLENNPDLSHFDNRRARITGTVVHEVLQKIVEDGLHQWPLETIANRRPFWIWRLKQLGMNSAESNIAADQVLLAIQRVLNDSNGMWLLDNSHPDSHCEYEIWSAGTANQEPRLSIIDRTFIHKGERWIIDYKSSQPDNSQTLDDFLQTQSEEYQEQLMRYRKIFEQKADSEKIPVRTALYFPMIQTLHEIQ